jgi:hypothetical protein
MAAVVIYGEHGIAKPVGDAQPAAEIDVLERDADADQFRGEGRHGFGGAADGPARVTCDRHARAG